MDNLKKVTDKKHKHCLMPNCISHVSGIKVSMHRFPKDNALKDKWLEAISTPNWVPTIGENSRICSVHFKPGSIKKLGNSTCISYDAIPNYDPLSHLTEEREGMKKIPAILQTRYFKIVYREGDVVRAVCQLCRKAPIISGSIKATSNFITHMKRLHKEEISSFGRYKRSYYVPGKKQRLPSIFTSDCWPSTSTVDYSGNSTSSFENSGTSTLTFEPSKQVKEISQFGGNTNNKPKDLQKKLDENILKYIINSMKPLSTVEDKFFKQIIEDLVPSDDQNKPKLTLMSQQTLASRIVTSNDEVLHKLKTRLKDIKYVSCTVDIWSVKQRSWMGVTVHWINEITMECESAVLACRRFKDIQSYDRVAEFLFEINSEFSLSHEQIVSTITDNGCNFVNAFKEFGCIEASNMEEFWRSRHNENPLDDEWNLKNMEDYEDELNFITINENDDEDNKERVRQIIDKVTPRYLPRHLRCASHSISLLGTIDFLKALKSAGTALRIHYPAMAKCTAIWNALRASKTAEIISKTLECNLSYPVPTKLNSLYDSLNDLIKNKTKLNSLLINLTIHSTFEEVELEYLEECCLIMKPIAGALEYLQSEKNCYYGHLLPALFSLKYKLELLREQHLKHFAVVLANLINFLTQRFEKFFNLSSEINEAILGPCFHPQFKLRWLPSDLCDSESNRIKNLCINEMENIESPDLEEKAFSEEEDHDMNSFIVFKSCGNKIKMENKSVAELEFATYITDKNKSIESLKNYRRIEKLFLKFNTSLCSSAPVERLFTFADFIHSSTRASMPDSLFEKLVFLKGNQSYMDMGNDVNT